MRSARALERPVTMSAWRPNGRTSEATSLADPDPKTIAVRRRELETHGGGRRYQSESGGNTFVNFTLDRGSAIMSATSSRQAA